MKLTAQLENVKTLAAALGVDEDTADSLLDVSVLISTNVVDVVGLQMATELKLLLERTVSVVVFDIDPARLPDVEVIIGSVTPRSQAKRLFVGIAAERIEINEKYQGATTSSIHHPCRKTCSG